LISIVFRVCFLSEVPQAAASDFPNLIALPRAEPDLGTQQAAEPMVPLSLVGFRKKSGQTFSLHSAHTPNAPRTFTPSDDVDEFQLEDDQNLTNRQLAFDVVLPKFPLVLALLNSDIFFCLFSSPPAGRNCQVVSVSRSR